jgi:hypothetical protein
MIHSFIQHSKDEKHLKGTDGVYLIRLLEAFINITFSDLGIEPLLGKDAIKNFNNIISKPYVTEILSKLHRQKI